MWSPQGWNFLFRRALNDWEIKRIAALFQILNTFPGTSNEPDKPIWKLQWKGVFTVKSCYWSSNAGQRRNRIWPWRLVWKIKIPLKVSCFAWLVCRRACLTHEVLQKKRRQICSRCFMCDQDAEVNGHLFLHCKVATNLWNMFFCILGVC